MHTGHDTCTEYHITDDDGNSNVIEQISEEKDLGVYITADLKPSLVRTVLEQQPKLDQLWEC